MGEGLEESEVTAIYIAGTILLLLLCAGLFVWQWRRLPNMPILPVSEQQAVREAEVNRELEEATNLPVKTRAKTINTVYYQQPKPGKKGQHKKKKNRKRHVADEVAKEVGL
jgi:type VI protein secretion system component VasK